jgi:hypothetical protein
MGTIPTLDQRTVLDRLYDGRKSVFRKEEDIHPWQAGSAPTLQMPLLRIWDQFSGSQPTGEGQMISRAPDMRLDNAESRRDSLAKHLDHSKWIPGPYVSFTTSPTAIESLAQWRLVKRGTQTLTVLRPVERIRNNLPILDVAAEMDHYDIPDPYGNKRQYHVKHYVCLWQIEKAEIVGQWNWTRLSENKNWYQEIIMPAFEKFTATTSAAIDGLQSNFNKLSGGLRGQLGFLRLTVQVQNDVVGHVSSDVSNGAFGNHPDDSYSDDDFGKDVYLDNDCGTDTDDDVEEANAADDVIKFIEKNYYG